MYQEQLLGGSVDIGVVPPTSYALDILGDTRTIGNVGIGTVPHSSTYKLDALGNLRLQGGGGIVSSGVIQANNGLTVSTVVLTANA